MITRFKTDFETTDNYRMPVCIGHGECVELQARLENGGVSVDLNGYTLSAIYQPLSAIGKHEWYQCNVENNLSSALVKWTNNNDFGSEGYRIFLYAKKGDEVSYPAIWDMRMYATPGFNPETVEPLPKIIDFNDYTILNAPWIDIDTYNGDIQRIDAALENHAQEIDTIDGTLEIIGNALNSEIQRATSAENAISARADSAFSYADSNHDAIQSESQRATGVEQTISAYTDLINSNLNHAVTEIGLLDTNKQDKLIAGENITITEDNIISASGGGGGPQIATRDIMYANQKAPIYINYGQSGQKQIGSIIEFAGWDMKNYVWMEDITSTTIDRNSGFVVGIYINPEQIIGLLPESFAGFHPVIMQKTKSWGRDRQSAYIVRKLESGCIELDATSSGGVIDLSVGTYTLNFYNESFPWESKTIKYTPILTAQFDKSWTGTYPNTLTHPVEPYTGGVKYGNSSLGPWIDSDIDSYYKYYLVPQAGSVKSVNGKTDTDITLTASDIKATNTQSIQANLERIDGEVEGCIDDIANLSAQIGDVETILNSL